MFLLYNFPCVFLWRAFGPHLMPYSLLILIGNLSQYELAESVAWIPGLATFLVVPAFLACWAWTNANLGGEFFFAFRKLKDCAVTVVGWIGLLADASDDPKASDGGCFAAGAFMVIVMIGFAFVSAIFSKDGGKLILSWVILIDLIALLIACFRYLPTFARDVWPQLKAIHSSRQQVRACHKKYAELLADAFPRFRLDAEILVCIPDSATPEVAFKEARDMVRELLGLVTTLMQDADRRRRPTRAADPAAVRVQHLGVEIAQIDQRIEASEEALAQARAAGQNTTLQERTLGVLRQQRRLLMDELDQLVKDNPVLAP
jgi:hypothetical protein